MEGSHDDINCVLKILQEGIPKTVLHTSCTSEVVFATWGMSLQHAGGAKLRSGPVPKTVWFWINLFARKTFMFAV